MLVFVSACFAKPDPQEPVQAYYGPPPGYYGPQQPYSQQQPQPPQPQQPQQQPPSTAEPAQQTAQTQQTPPAQQPAPQQPYPQQPYPQQPYPQQPYPQQPYPPNGVTATSSSSSGGLHLHDGEIIGDFATVGALASIDILARQDVHNGSAVSFILLAGTAGGAGIGYALTQKYHVDSGAAHATTLGLMLGAANGALLVEPTGWERGQSVLGLLLAGSAVGVTGGFAYGQAAHLTPGQATFVGNLTLLGAATAALGAITGSRDGSFGSWENTSLALGLDGGALAGALIAPKLDWSPRRAKTVFVSTTIGALAGGMLVGLLAKPKDGSSSDTNGDLAAAGMTAGLWGGFGLGILMTKETAPDPRFTQPKSNAAASTSFVPWLGERGQMGVMAGGTF